MAKRKSRRGTKTRAVRSYMEQHPQASAAEIVSALNGQGIKVSAAIIYNLRSVAKNKRRTRVGAAGGNGVAMRAGRPRNVGSVSLSEEQLLATKQLADQLGGTDALRRTLDLLEKLT